MSETLRRFEVLLPLRFNDGSRVPDELIADTLLELRGQFGAVSCETQTIHGFWQHDSQLFRDDLIRVFVDVGDTADSSRFFSEFKERLKSRFRQIDIWVSTYLIEII